jgi:hypothetical protein
VSPVKFELGFYIPEDDILHSNCRENLKSYIALTGWTVSRRRNVSPVRYEVGFYIQEDILLTARVRLALVRLMRLAMALPCYDSKATQVTVFRALRTCVYDRVGAEDKFRDTSQCRRSGREDKCTHSFPQSLSECARLPVRHSGQADRNVTVLHVSIHGAERHTRNVVETGT